MGERMEEFQTVAKILTENSTEDSNSKLCMEVIEDHWAQRTGGTASQFENAIRKQLDAPNASQGELNKLFEDAVKKREVDNRGSIGSEIFNAAIKALHCK
jgi:hypothetical protein